MIPQVSVITPTWGRHERLLNRCIPSVQAQTHRRVEHIIVSDGPDPELAAKIAERRETFYHPVYFIELTERAPDAHWGHYGRLAGIAISEGAYIAYVDDDDSLRAEHCALLARALDANPGCAWAYSVMASHSRADCWTEIGYGPPMGGQIGTPMLMHRRAILEHGTWGPASSTEDWELVQRWMAAGQEYIHVPEVTIDVWPSAYWSDVM